MGPAHPEDAASRVVGMPPPPHAWPNMDTYICAFLTQTASPPRPPSHTLTHLHSRLLLQCCHELSEVAVSAQHVSPSRHSKQDLHNPDRHTAQHVKPWQMAHQTLVHITPNPGPHHTKPWVIVHRTLGQSASNPEPYYTKPWSTAHKTLSHNTPNLVHCAQNPEPQYTKTNSVCLQRQCSREIKYEIQQLCMPGVNMF